MLVKCISGCLPVNKDCVASEAEWAVRVKEWDDPGSDPRSGHCTSLSYQFAGASVNFLALVSSSVKRR